MFRFFHFLWWMETSVFPTPPRKFWKLSLPYLGRKVMTKLDSIFKSRDITLPTTLLSSQGYGFSSGHVWMWELDCEEGWVLKNCCFWTVVLEKTLESPMDCKEIQPVHSKGDSSQTCTMKAIIPHHATAVSSFSSVASLFLFNSPSWLSFHSLPQSHLISGFVSLILRSPNSASP